MDGGFVTANCCKCREKEPLSNREFHDLPIWVSCPDCKNRMRGASLDRSGTYGYRCSGCPTSIRLADLLPLWSDIMP